MPKIQQPPRQPMTEAECATSRKAVLSAVRETRLGRGLLAQLNKIGVAIVFTDQMPQLNDNTRVRGVFDGAQGALLIDAAAPLTEQLHYFAHESRHALQMYADMQISAKDRETSVHLLSPLTQLYLMRLREIDADTFAVHFLAQHDRATGSKHFDVMSQPAARDGDYDRSRLYRAYADAPDAVQGLRASAHEFLAYTAIVNGYNNFALDMWEDRILPPMADNAQKPRSAYAREFAAAARRAYNTAQPAELFNQRAVAYSKILNRSGMPDYLAGANVDQFRKTVCDAGADTDPWKTTGHALERAMLDFNAAIRHYSRMKAPANSNKQSAQPRAPRRGQQP